MDTQRIPKAFQIASYKFRVVHMSAEELEQIAGEPVYALFVPDHLLIMVRRKSKRLDEQIRRQSFWHEYAHALLWVMNRAEWENEDFVDALGHHFAQFGATVKY